MLSNAMVNNTNSLTNSNLIIDSFMVNNQNVKQKISSLLNGIINFKQKNLIKIRISKFKKIDNVELNLEPINIFIGANNSGKSSFIQGIQFAISSCQTLELKKVNWQKKADLRILALDSSDYLYTPTRQIENLYHGEPLTGSKLNTRKAITFRIQWGDDTSHLNISKGRNGGFTTHQSGSKLGRIISDITTPFCVYVPGIAGIPIVEKYEVPIGIKKSATRGDSNNYLRNIIHSISEDKTKWFNFHTSINAIYSDVELIVNFDENTSEYIEIYIKSQKMKLPIDSVGTGILQTIQIFAYLEYFQPKILLLDEPDSHIHPSKQKLLANELHKRSKEDPNLKIVISTHSRYILDSLENNAQVIHFQNGDAFIDINGSKILLDIGAADAEYLFSKKNLKYIIATEDKVDNVIEKKRFIEKFLRANNLTEDEVVLHSYEGCTKIHFAKLLEEFVRKHIPTVKVIVHVDRDQKDDKDQDLIRIRENCEKQNILLFITEYSEVENYFCTPAHIHNIYELPLSDCNRLVQDFIDELSILTKTKIKNFIMNQRKELCLNEDGRIDDRIITKYAEKFYAENSKTATPGKELIGMIKNHLQKNNLDPNLISNSSPALFNEQFQKLLST